MIELVLKSLYVMIPGILANMAPLFMRDGLFRKLATPIDFGFEFKGKPLFGKNKTYRGFVAGILVAILGVYIQYHLYSYVFFRELSLIDYSSWLAFGFLMGFGVMFGDLVGSFFKRRLGIGPGQPFLFVDQADSVLGGIAFILPVYVLPLDVAITAILLAVAVSFSTNFAGYYIGLKKTKF